jgi:hypothetical protein
MGTPDSFPPSFPRKRESRASDVRWLLGFRFCGNDEDKV